MEAENQKTESGREHQRRACVFNAAEQKVFYFAVVLFKCFYWLFIYCRFYN